MKAAPALLAWLLAAACAPAAAQTVVPAGSEIRFVSKQMGVPVEGRFERWQAELQFDPAQPQAARVAITIDTRSIAFGAAETEAEAAKPAWFDSARFAQAQFRASGVKALGAGRYEVAGSLTLKGQTRELQLPVTLAAGPAPGQATASGSFTLKRMDFKLGEGEWADLSVVANEVQVRFKLLLAGVKLP
ncbi:MAG: YceI family protein [Proteobacteria bacterium]|nr:YceI family protein [Pseudomonadota bacterium]